MNICQTTAYITAIANSLAYKLSTEELAFIAAILVQLGDTLATIATQRTLTESKTEITL